MQTKNPRIRTLLYEDQRLNPGEIDLLHTPALQRLYDLHQLGLTDRVYIDASHSRLHHVVGVLEQADKIVDAIIQSLNDRSDRKFVIDKALVIEAGAFADDVVKKKPVIRLIGLLHDLTHAPYGHTIEDEIGLVACKHDEPERQSEAFYRLICQYIGWIALEVGVRPTNSRDAQIQEMPTELWNYLMAPETTPPASWLKMAQMGSAMLRTDRLWRRSGGKAKLGVFLAQLACAMRALLYLDVLHADKIDKKNTPLDRRYAFELLIHKILKMAGMGSLLDEWGFLPARDAYMLDVIGNTVCADLLDYAQRDSHFAGMKLGYDADRIAENFTLVSWKPKKKDRRVEGVSDPFPGKALRTAISLYSHKLRTDVAGELMNLLNVRFYLYERALFHPTKCAAGAMLGTALQLMGWRPLRKDSSGQIEQVHSYELPSQFRHVGDAVFLHDLQAAVQIVLAAFESHKHKPSLDSLALKQSIGFQQSSQLLVAHLICDRWNGRPPGEAIESISAGRELLRRVMARRFYKAVFRNLPNSRNETLDKGPEELADKFKDAVTRFDAERSIEAKAGLRPGSVVIHCPRRITAQKIANVLLVFPKPGGKGEAPRKLREMGEIDRDVFSAHQDAVLAVEKMYESMWRLVVYATPETMSNYIQVGKDAGEVIFKTMDTDNSSGGEIECWKNDQYLESELREKFGGLEAAVAATATTTTVAGSPIPKPSSPSIPSEVPIASHSGRQQKLVTVLRLVWRPDLEKAMPTITTFYDRELRELPHDQYEVLLSRFQSEYASIPATRRPRKIEDVLDELRALKDGAGGPLFTAR